MDKKEALQILDEIDTLRRKYEHTPTEKNGDWLLRIACAIVAQKAGFNSRVKWIEEIRKDKNIMLKRNIADKLQILFVDRIREEQPDRELTHAEIENIWYTIYGKLCRGETEKEVEQWCKTVEIRKK